MIRFRLTKIVNLQFIGRKVMVGVLKGKSDLFAMRIVELMKFLQVAKSEYVPSEQILKCGIAVGAGVYGTELAQSETDYTDKLSFAFKERSEIVLRLKLLKNTHYLDFILFRKFGI